MLKLMSNVSNGVKQYSGLTTDTLPVNPPIPEGMSKEEYDLKLKQSRQGDSAMLVNPATNKLVYKIFDEENNVWREV